MKQIIALQEYTDQYVSLYEGEIRKINQPLANRLIAEGVVAEHAEDSKSNLMIVTLIEEEDEDGEYDYYPSHSASEIYQAIQNGINVIGKYSDLIFTLTSSKSDSAIFSRFQPVQYTDKIRVDFFNVRGKRNKVTLVTKTYDMSKIM